VITHRRGDSLDDLRTAGDLVSRAWLARTPLVAATTGGMEWWHASSYPDALGEHLRLWQVDGRDVAWTWEDTGEIEWHIWSGDAASDVAVMDAILEGAGSGTIASWAAEDDAAVIAAFERAGLAPADRRLSQFQQRVDREAELPDPRLPDGYRIRGLAGPEEVAARVDVHRAAFTPSRLSTEKYERLITMPHYRFEDDLVVEAPDGSLAAFAMAWWDPIGRTGEFEPVGTHPTYQRRGLGRALLGHGLRRFRDLGATTVQVYSDASNTASEALYEAVGFRRRAFHRRYERPGGANPDVRSGP
jgi:ribosomal protein S18 acetylase RimI-like enzyme